MNCLLQDELNCGCLFEVLTRYLNYQGDEHIYALASEVTKQPKGTSCLYLLYHLRIKIQILIK